MLKVENRHSRYSAHGVPVLNGASLELNQGQVGILLGKGLTIDQAKEELAGVTLESLVVAERVARAVKKHIAKGKLSAKDFKDTSEIPHI